MTDPIVKQALLDIVDVMRDITTLVDKIDRRVRKMETDVAPKRTRLAVMRARAYNQNSTTLEQEDTDPDGDGHVGIWGYINNHEDILTRILERLDKLEQYPTTKTALHKALEISTEF